MFRNKGVKLTSSVILLGSASSLALHAQGGASSEVVSKELLNKTVLKNNGNFLLKTIVVVSGVLVLVGLYYLVKGVVAYFRPDLLEKTSDVQGTGDVSKNASKVGDGMEIEPVLKREGEKSEVDIADEADGQPVLDEKVGEKKDEEDFFFSETPPPGGYYVDINENDVVSGPKNEEVQEKEPKVTISSERHKEMLESLEAYDKRNIGKGYEDYSSGSDAYNKHLYLIQRGEFGEIDKDGLCKEDFNKIDKLEDEACALLKSMAGSGERVRSIFREVYQTLCEIQISVANKMKDEEAEGEGYEELRKIGKLDPRVFTDGDDIFDAMKEVEDRLNDNYSLGGFCIKVEKNLGLSTEGKNSLKAVFENNAEEKIADFHESQQYTKLKLYIKGCREALVEEDLKLGNKISDLKDCRDDWDTHRCKIINFLKSNEVKVVPQEDNVDNDNNDNNNNNDEIINQLQSD